MSHAIYTKILFALVRRGPVAFAVVQIETSSSNRKYFVSSVEAERHKIPRSPLNQIGFDFARVIFYCHIQVTIYQIIDKSMFRLGKK